MLGTSWAAKTGLSKTMPMPGPDWADYGPWTRRVQIDLDAFREYAQAVYANSDEYLASLMVPDLDRPIDMSFAGIGEVPLGWLIGRYVVGHIDNICGEVSCLKGLQGAQG